jgi:hypothetical protein
MALSGGDAFVLFLQLPACLPIGRQSSLLCLSEVGKAFCLFMQVSVIFPIDQRRSSPICFGREYGLHE